MLGSEKYATVSRKVVGLHEVVGVHQADDLRARIGVSCGARGCKRPPCKPGQASTCTNFDGAADPGSTPPPGPHGRILGVVCR